NYEAFRLPRLSLRECLTYTEHEAEMCFRRSHALLRALGICLTEDVPALRVTDEDNASAGFARHCRRNLSGEGALLCPMNVLNPSQDIRSPADCSGDGGQRNRGWEDNNRSVGANA